jgi:hypothetical protein
VGRRNSASEAAETRNETAFTANAVPNPPTATMMPADAKPSTVPSERPVTSSPLARTRWSCPTISGTLLRSATVNSVFPTPKTSATAASRTLFRGPTASATMARA